MKKDHIKKPKGLYDKRVFDECLLALAILSGCLGVTSIVLNIYARGNITVIFVATVLAGAAIAIAAYAIAVVVIGIITKEMEWY